MLDDGEGGQGRPRPLPGVLPPGCHRGPLSHSRGLSGTIFALVSGGAGEFPCPALEHSPFPGRGGDRPDLLLEGCRAEGLRGSGRTRCGEAWHSC